MPGRGITRGLVYTDGCMTPAPGSAAAAIRLRGDRRAADVIVVGSGNAGLCAALAAREAGARVLLLERAPVEWLGGGAIGHEPIGLPEQAVPHREPNPRRGARDRRGRKRLLAWPAGWGGVRAGCGRWVRRR
jgi:glycine/D-amino acid oxidase-like deaminating enzyme